MKIQSDFLQVWPQVIRFFYGLQAGYRLSDTWQHEVTVEHFEQALELTEVAMYYELRHRFHMISYMISYMISSHFKRCSHVFTWFLAVFA